MIVKTSLKYINTLKYLTLSQIFWQCRYRVYKSKLSNIEYSGDCASVGSNDFFWTEKLSYVDDSSISLININKKYTLPGIWKNVTVDDLWLYNVHYFDFLNNDLVCSKLKLILVNNWISFNNSSSVGLQAYPTSLRIVNWIKWYIKNDIKNDINNDKIIASIYSQIILLSKNLEFHISGNHLMSNIKALIISGLFFGCSKSVCNSIYHNGMRLLSREIKNQILECGGHYELSPMYHNIVLEDLLDIVHFHYIYKKKFDLYLIEIIKKMLFWSYGLSHPDSEVSFFNDSVIGISSKYSNLNKYAEALGITTTFDKEFIAEFDGYFIAKQEGLDLKFDAANIGAMSQPGHAHADTLSFELSIDNHRVFVNSGISTYHNTSDRILQRSTMLHSTVSVNNINSSDVWSKFRVADRAYVFNKSAKVTDSGFVFSASHDGYRSVCRSMVHTRKITLSDNDIYVHDTVDNCKNNTVNIYFYLHPSVVIDDHGIADDKEFKKINISVNGSLFLVSSRISFRILKSNYFCSFNSRVDSNCLLVSYKTNGIFCNELIVKKLSRHN
jgi:uncharacterized heparinase superfamily protein